MTNKDFFTIVKCEKRHFSVFLTNHVYGLNIFTNSLFFLKNIKEFFYKKSKTMNFYTLHKVLILKDK